MTVPGAISDLVNVASITSATQIGLDWTESTFVSGSLVTDFKIEYDQGIDTWVTLETDIVDSAYTAIQLSTGTWYKFRVYARNA